jgi:hypothetical protein
VILRSLIDRIAKNCERSMTAADRSARQQEPPFKEMPALGAIKIGYAYLKSLEA